MDEKQSTYPNPAAFSTVPVQQPSVIYPRQLVDSYERPRTDSGYETISKHSPLPRMMDLFNSFEDLPPILSSFENTQTEPDFRGPGFYDSEELYSGRTPPPENPRDILGSETTEGPPYKCSKCEEDPEVNPKPSMKNKSDFQYVSLTFAIVG